MPGAYRAPTSQLRQWLPGLLLYLLLALISAPLTFPETNIPAVWLPTGLGVALLLGAGLNAVPVVVTGSILASLTTQSLLFGGLSPSMLYASVSQAMFSLLGPIIVYLLFQRLSVSERRTLRDYRFFIRLIGIALLSMVVISLPQTLLMHSAPAAPLPFPQLVLAQWISHMLGLILVAPLAMARWQRPNREWLTHRLPELAGWIMALLVVVAIIHQQQLGALYLMLPLMIWAATRFSLVGGALAISAASGLSLWLLFRGSAAIADPENTLMLHALVMLMALSAIYVRIILEDRARVEARLENTVDERTEELTRKNQELEDEIYVRQQAEKSFRRSSRHYRALLETAGSPIVVVDSRFRIRQWNSASEELFGYSRDEVVGENMIGNFIPESYRDELNWKLTKLIQGGLPQEQVELKFSTQNHHQRTVLWNLTLLEEEDATDEPQVVLVGQDITEMRSTQDQLHFLAHYDVLTNTANRRLFEDRCRQAVEQSARYNHRCALLNLDVDHFKRINDTLGHDAGDALLKTMSDRLRESVRGEDTIGRLGGDEFAVLLNQVSGPEGCEKVARNLLHNLTQPVQVPGGELIITSSIGITIAPDDGRTYEELLKNADMAMYRAKKSGRNTIEFFSPEMNADMQRQLRTERELRSGIRDGQMDLHYQPVIDLRNGSIVSMEALLRWHHPREGVLPPAHFLDVAEHSGQLLELGEWVCYNACLQGRLIQNLSGHPVPVSINLSARQYQHPQLAATLERVIRETNTPPRLLCVEINERILAEQTSASSDVLHRLKRLGVTLVLDCFGSGLSSIRHLQELPFDQVKLDRSLLAEVPSSQDACAIVSTMVRLVRQMDMGVIASGVERDDQLQFLESVDCRLAQGYRFCRAIPSDDLAQLFQRAQAGENFDASIQIDLLRGPERE